MAISDTPRHSYSTSLGMDPTGGTTYASIGTVVSLKYSGPKRKTIEIPDLGMTAQAIKKLRGNVNHGAFTLTMRFTPLEYAILLTAVTAGSNTGDAAFKLTLPLAAGESVAASFTWKGFPTEVPFDVPDDQDLQLDGVVIEVDGAITYTQAT